MVTASQMNLKGLAPAYTTACSVTLLLPAKNSQLLKGGLVLSSGEGSTSNQVGSLLNITCSDQNSHGRQTARLSSGCRRQRA